MQDIESTVWRRKGSCIIYESGVVASLLADGCLLPLREVLSWRRAWPSAYPIRSSTILVGGLEACLELLTPVEAESFLREQVKPLIREFQRRWDNHGLVFGFGANAGAFQIDPFSEEVRFVRRDQTAVRLSFAMWDGSTDLKLSRIVHPTGAAKAGATIGFYVPRIS